MLALTQGESYLLQQDHHYIVLCFDLDKNTEPKYASYPKRTERLSRIYPNLIGMLGNPGDALFIAHRSPKGWVHFVFGYIRWSCKPVFIHRTEQRIIAQSIWERVWGGQYTAILDPAHSNWIGKSLDRKTRRVKRLLARNLA